MPFNVLRCYECKTFQIHPQTKSSKWRCKMCNEKQSIVKVHMTGTAPECRKAVQQLNMRQGQVEDIFSTALLCPQPTGLHMAASAYQTHITDTGPESKIPEGQLKEESSRYNYHHNTKMFQDLHSAVSLPHKAVKSVQVLKTGQTQSKWSKYLSPSELIDSSSEEDEGFYHTSSI